MANAQHMAHCVNVHDLLLSTLKRVYDRLDEAEKMYGWEAHKIQEAITKAEGESEVTT